MWWGVDICQVLLCFEKCKAKDTRSRLYTNKLEIYPFRNLFIQNEGKYGRVAKSQQGDVNACGFRLGAVKI